MRYDSSRPGSRRAYILSGIVFALVFLLSSCGQKALSSSGTVKLWIPREDSELMKTAAEIPGLAVEAPAPDAPWLKTLENPETAPDLILAEWGRDLLQAGKAGLLTDLTPYRSRHKVFGTLLPGFTRKDSLPKEFLPASVYTWGLFYNEAVLKSAGVEPPATWDDFQNAVSRLKAMGTVPIALGSSFGWPALAWFSCLDLRLNGLAAHRKLLDGTRAFTDPSLKTVFDMLEVWRDTGIFDPEASGKNWPEAIAMVASGKAGFALLGSFAVTRLQDAADVRFIRVPVGSRKVDLGELIVLQGFTVPRDAKNPEAALNLAAQYVTRETPGQTMDAYRVVPLAKKTFEGFSPHKTTELETLRNARGYVPQIDRIFPAQAAYDVNQAFIRFFRPNSGMRGSELAETLDRIRPAAAK